MKQLTQNQIQELFEFTKAHRVRHFDVQTEVVDHLASAIEEKWAMNPNLSFEKALNQVYTGFGIFGFGKLEQEKTEVLNTKLLRKTWKYVKSFLTIPKIFLTILLIGLLHNFLLVVDNAIIITKYIGIGQCLLFYIFLGIKKRAEKELFEHFLEVKATFLGMTSSVFLFYLNPHIQLFGQDVHSNGIIFCIAIIQVLSLITFIGMYQYMEQTISDIKKRYPRYQIV